MARKGRAGAALGIAAISSFIAGTVGIVLLTLVAPPLAEFALSFGAAEYFALICLGLSLVTMLSGRSAVKGMLALLVGLWLSSIGTDLFSAQSRFTFGMPELIGGINFIVVVIGIFAIGEVLINIEKGHKAQMLPVPKGLRNLLPSWEELKACRFAFLNGSLVGFFVGLLPGAGSTIGSFLSYGLEKAVSRHPEKFGTGVPEGLAAPEGANNADTGGALVPVLTLGIPGGAGTAMLLTALMMWGYRPGPMLMIDAPDIFWGLVASMYIGNVALLVMNLPMVPLFAQILRTPLHLLFTLILGFSMIGIYGVSDRYFEISLMVGFGVMGYLMSKLDFPAAPLVLGMVLGEQLERSLRQMLIISNGELSPLFTSNLAAVMMGFAVIIALSPLVSKLNRARIQAAGEAD